MASPPGPDSASPNEEDELKAKGKCSKISMKSTGAQIIAQLLKSHGVKYIFSLCGTSIQGVIVESHRAGIKIIDFRSVICVTSGPGLTNTVTAAQDSKFDDVPLIIFSGAVPTTNIGIGDLQDMDHVGLMERCTKLSFSINSKSEIIPGIKNAFYQARSDNPGPVYVQLPTDVLESLGDLDFNSGPEFPINSENLENEIDSEDDSDERKGQSISCTLLKPIKPVTPKASEIEIQASINLIKKAKKPMIIVSSQATLRPSKTKLVGDALKDIGIPVFPVHCAIGIMGKKHQLLFSQPRKIKEALEESDCVILGGIICDFFFYFGLKLQKGKGTSVISVHRSIQKATLNAGRFWKVKQAIKSDVGYYFMQLAKHFKGGDKPDYTEWISKLRKTENDFEKQLKDKAMEKSDKHLNPLRVLYDLENAKKDSDILWTFDQGDFAVETWFYLKPLSPNSWIVPGAFAQVGGGVGYAIGAKLAAPESDVWCVVGDGSCGYHIVEFDTLRRHKIHITVVCGNDAEWMEICRKQVAQFKTSIGCTLEYDRYEKVAEVFGANGIFLDEKDLDNLESKFQSVKPPTDKSTFINVLIGKTNIRAGTA